IHAGASVSTARARALAMLQEVKLADPEAVMERYPHQLSGGQQQRIVIAMALIAGPALLIMDEPTTGLDVTVEAAVLDLVRALRSRRDRPLHHWADPRGGGAERARPPCRLRARRRAGAVDATERRGRCACRRRGA